MVFRAPRLYLLGLIAASGVVLPSVTLGGSMQDAVTDAPFPEWGDERPWLTALRSTLHEHFSRPLRMQAIARELDVHPVHVSRGFTRRYGMSMTQYLRDLRVMRAGELLLTTSAPVSRIAQSTGFSDHAHLTRVFTARIGVAPSTFRRINCCAAAA
jgi:transcriptional regulator GlxA family with amidase domain